MTITSLLRSAPMIRRRRLALLLTLAAFLATTIAATPAEAAKRKVPFGFFGTVFNNARRPTACSDATLDAQMALMARSGVESVRSSITWADSSQQQGVYNFARLRPGRRQRPRGIDLDVLPNVLHTPRWASTQARSRQLPAVPAARTRPRTPNFMKTLIKRYGPKGSFWKQLRACRSMPIRQLADLERAEPPLLLGHAPVAAVVREAAGKAYRAIHKAGSRRDRGGWLASSASPAARQWARSAISTRPAPRATSTSSRCTPSRRRPSVRLTTEPDARHRPARPRRDEARARPRARRSCSPS